MTYDEYKNKSKSKKRNLFQVLISKLFTVIIFTMIVIIISNNSPKFRDFLTNDVLNSTMDFSKINKFINRLTNVFENNEVLNVSKEVVSDSEEYLDGVKYKVEKNSDIVLKDSGIVTYIGKKKGYNNTIIIQQSNGYYAWYGNIKENVKLYDFIEKGSVIGSSLSNEYYYALFKDDKKVSINEN